MSTSTTIVEKINKLLALSSSSNQAEAEAALAKARKLMIEHMIDEDDLTAAKTEKVEVKVAHVENYEGVVRRPLVEDNLAVVVAEAFSTRMAMSRYYIFFYGVSSDAEVAAYAFQTLRQTVWGMAAVATSKHTEELKRLWGVTSIRGIGGPDHPKTWRNAYVMGLVDGLRERVRLEKLQDTSNVTALVLKRDMIIKAHLNTLRMGTRSIATTVGSSNGYYQGREDSKQLSLRKGLEGGSETKRLNG